MLSFLPKKGAYRSLISSLGYAPENFFFVAFIIPQNRRKVKSCYPSGIMVLGIVR